MSNLSSSLGTSQPFIPFVNSTQIGRASGFVINFASAAALQEAIAQEKENVAASVALWVDGQPISDASMPIGSMRYWNVTGAGSATRVTLPGGLLHVLATDANVVRVTTGAPSGGLGVDGDVAVDLAAMAYYVKTSGAWGSSITLVLAGSPVPHSGFTYVVPLQSALTQLAPATIIANTAFTRDPSPVAGASAVVTLTGDGTHIPDLSAFPALQNSDDFDVNAKNLVAFGFDGVNYFHNLQKLAA